MVVDGVWATVGSTNLDRRSFAPERRAQPRRVRRHGRSSAAASG
jgi:hypothetical protein